VARRPNGSVRPRRATAAGSQPLFDTHERERAKQTVHGDEVLMGSEHWLARHPAEQRGRAPSAGVAGAEAAAGRHARSARPPSCSASSGAMDLRPARCRSGSPAQRARSRSSAGPWPAVAAGELRPGPGPVDRP
jgi:hypothetical protein